MLMIGTFVWNVKFIFLIHTGTSTYIENSDDERVNNKQLHTCEYSACPWDIDRCHVYFVHKVFCG